MNRLQEALVRSRLRQVDLADLTGTHPTLISKIVHDRRAATPQVKARIARVLGARVRDLFPIEREDESTVSGPGTGPRKEVTTALD